MYIWLSRTPPWHEDHRNKVREWLFAEQEQTEATSQLLSFVKEQRERERQLRGTWDAHEEPEGRGAGAGQRVIGCEDVGAEEVVVVEGAPCCIARATVSTPRASLRRRGAGRLDRAEPAAPCARVTHELKRERERERTIID